ncbi:hypothetical protein C8R26_11652 [Nitrosomonas oligotropha]|uniref:Uncharacterized protein n=1 Tax=Nitrosomonas oligotropha TaxID=42354 RepID=A0A2T5HYJ1_9PROT|nr:hypothetical protein C8R26_11652 [Nitrosomonas oligotropha]
MSSLLLIGSVWNKIFLMHLIHHEKQRESAILGHPIRVFSWLQLPVLLLGWLRFLLALNASDEMGEPWMDATGNIWRHPIEN